MSALQVLVNGLIEASELALLAVGLTMIYDLLRFANFTHTEFAVVGAYLALFFNVALGLDIYLAVALAAPLTGLIAIALDRAVFRRLRHASRVTLMVTSFGLGIALRNLIRAIWGPTQQSFAVPLQSPMLLGDIRITPLSLVIIGTAVGFMVFLHLLLHHTRLGKAMRAVSDNPEMAQASAINSERVITWVWFIAAGLAAIGGSLIGIGTFLKPILGFKIMVLVFSAAILGGLGNPYGAMLGALVVGLAGNFGLSFDYAALLNLGGLVHVTDQFYIPAGYKEAIAFVFLIGILLWRPRGILGRKESR